MPKHPAYEDSVSEICVDPQPSGLRAVFLVETRTPEEARELGKLFTDLESQASVRQLSKGQLISYVVQTDESEAFLLDEVESVLRENYAFVVTHRSFDEVIYRIVRELSEDTGSRLTSISHCNICGKVDPFPNVVVNLASEDGSVLMSRHYCGSCTAQTVASSNKEFVRSLLAADKRNFTKLEQAELVRRPSRKQPIRFKIKPDAGRLARA